MSENKEVKDTLLNKGKIILKTTLKSIIKHPIMIALIVGAIAIIVLSVSLWFMKKNDTKENDKDPKNAPAAARSYMNEVNVGADGKITLGKSISEWWQELKKRRK